MLHSRALFGSLLLCATWNPVAAANDPFPSTYTAPITEPTVLRNATVLTGIGERLDGADVLLQDGRIVAVGQSLIAPAGAIEIDASDRWITPGLIDVHSHLGIFGSLGAQAHMDGNETTDPVTAGVWAEHSIWPHDPGFGAALAGGVTTLQILPGSANLIGGRGITLKNVPATTYQAMRFPDAPRGLKMACGENPKRNYGQARGRAPATRMGNVAGYRQAFADAQDYRNQQLKHAHELAQWEAKPSKERGSTFRPGPPKRDLRLESLVAAMEGEILVHMHCYRADEMVLMLDVAKEFGFQIVAFHHATEAYKIAPLLAEHRVCGALWADWWGFKMESFDGIQENVAMVDHPAHGCAIVHSDSDEGIQRLNHEAAKAMTSGRRAGLDTPPERAIRWITANAAQSLGILERTGTIEPGKMADVVVWNRDPFSVYAKADLVFVDGALRYDRLRPPGQPASDFSLGQSLETTP
jgi:imidazolonepropionase-like amidohydrolase